MKEYISRVIEGKSLSEFEAEKIMDAIMEGEATAAQIGALLMGLRIKGETIEEITGFARTMRRRAVRFSVQRDVVDTCGTGGDCRGTFNISTAASFVVAGAGLAVAKHGNRSVSSRCGSADVLEHLGVKVDLEPHLAEKCLEEVGIAFLFAPKFHLAMKYAAGPRKEIGVRTVFNVLGPLTNPAGAAGQVLGVFDPGLTEPLASVLGALGCRRAFVVHGTDGLDEITIAGPTRVTELNAGFIHTYLFDPRDVGISLGTPEDMQGGSAADNARIIRNVLKGEKGPQRDVVLVNSAFALLAGNKAVSLEDALFKTGRSIDSGAALGKLDGLIRYTGSCVA